MAAARQRVEEEDRTGPARADLAARQSPDRGGGLRRPRSSIEVYYLVTVLRGSSWWPVPVLLNRAYTFRNNSVFIPLRLSELPDFQSGCAAEVCIIQTRSAQVRAVERCLS
jgi:hypothetical protein